MVAIHGNTGRKKKVQNVNLKSPEGTVIMKLFIYSAVYKYFYVTPFLKILTLPLTLEKWEQTDARTIKKYLKGNKQARTSTWGLQNVPML